MNYYYNIPTTKVSEQPIKVVQTLNSTTCVIYTCNWDVNKYVVDEDNTMIKVIYNSKVYKYKCIPKPDMFTITSLYNYNENFNVFNFVNNIDGTTQDDYLIYPYNFDYSNLSKGVIQANLYTYFIIEDGDIVLVLTTPNRIVYEQYNSDGGILAPEGNEIDIVDPSYQTDNFIAGYVSKEYGKGYIRRIVDKDIQTNIPTPLKNNFISTYHPNSQSDYVYTSNISMFSTKGFNFQDVVDTSVLVPGNVYNSLPINPSLPSSIDDVYSYIYDSQDTINNVIYITGYNKIEMVVYRDGLPYTPLKYSNETVNLNTYTHLTNVVVIDGIEQEF